MARTRTSEPETRGALLPGHDRAARAEHRHKRSLYASPGLRLAGLALLLVAARPAPAAAGPPCAPCVRLSVTPEQALEAAGPLNGALVFVRVDANAVAAAAPALRRLQTAGVRPGFHLIGIPEEPGIEPGADVQQVAIDVRGPVDAAGVLRLKQTLVRARAHLPAAALLLALDSGDPGVADALRPYIDVLLAPTRELDDLMTAARAEDERLWTLAADDAAILQQFGRAQTLLPRNLAPAPGRVLSCDGRSLDTYLDAATAALIGVGRCSGRAAIAGASGSRGVEVVSLGIVDVVRITLGEDTVHEDVAIAGRRQLTAEEIVARHQAFAAAQTAAVRTRISTADFTLTFEAPGFPAPVTVTARSLVFVGPDATELQQRELRVNGVPFAPADGVPRLPILEPERIAAPPLSITLTDVYRYRLTGETMLRGRRCYVLDFTPERSAPLAAGTAWIDEEAFALVRVRAVQTNLRGPITASEQSDDYAPDANGRWLPLRTEVNQTYEGASFRTPIHRLLAFVAHEVNPASFEQQLAAAHASRDVMLRDSPQGFRYLRREQGTAAAADGGRAVTRVSAGRLSRVRTIAMGVLVDPNISRPLPFAGLGYADFNLFNRGGQFDGFFGGSYGQAAFAWPSLGRSRWQLTGRAFAIAASYNDRAFAGGREQYDRDIRQRPASASVALRHPWGPRTTVRVEYGVDYVAYRRADVTSPAFRMPASQQVHSLRLGADIQRGEWQLSLWWSGSRRIGWRAWGMAGDGAYDPSQADFQRFGAGATRTAALSPRLSTRIEAAMMSGVDLDRFSRFSFGTFDNRLHGYPSALIRYDRGAVLRTAIAWSAGGGVRLDGFADAAQVHDPGFGRGLRNYSGIGAAAELPAPWRTLAAVEWSYGIQARNSAGARGTQVVRITAYKVF